jgi:hypothetical protein
MADEWWGRQKGLRQTLRTEVAVGGKGPDAQLDQWAITIRFEDENTSPKLLSAAREDLLTLSAALRHWCYRPYIGLRN